MQDLLSAFTAIQIGNLQLELYCIAEQDCSRAPIPSMMTSPEVMALVAESLRVFVVCRANFEAVFLIKSDFVRLSTICNAVSML